MLYSLSEIQKELQKLPPKRVVELTARLGRFKKENKELLAYLLFEADDEDAYIERIKEEIDQHFEEINRSNLYLAKKGLRKIARIINKQIRFSGKTTTEIALRIYYCRKMKSSSIEFTKSPVLVNLYAGQLKKIDAGLEKIHDEERLDYAAELKSIR